MHLEPRYSLESGRVWWKTLGDSEGLAATHVKEGGVFEQPQANSKRFTVGSLVATGSHQSMVPWGVEPLKSKQLDDDAASKPAPFPFSGP
ncbi:hypothetical protein M413DRAFT_81600 [Hebeloma cylindrosporum]|uniref:Uncharacterized protein n=1 Tax=Hebeloma cylindrosporum TaxID=76867 RepID=A0A0C2YFT9_HEBCY|nr:hypothetical protein M413DRAFT_81600 [Hebeloma cylindrosporum h7]